MAVEGINQNEESQQLEAPQQRQQEVRDIEQRRSERQREALEEEHKRARGEIDTTA